VNSSQVALARDLLRELRERGVEVRPDPPDRILFRGPVDDDLRARIREAKPALLAYLSHPPTWPCSRCGKFAFGQPHVVCYWCKRQEERPAHA
jgi:hypothetical protein